MSNNFLNRKQFNLNLYNKKTYKESNCKNILRHPLLNSFIKPICNNYDQINLNNIGLWIPFNNECNDKNIKINLHQYNLNLDSSDRDYNVYTNPFDYTIRFNPTSTDPKPYITSKPLQRIKYLSINGITFPINYKLIRSTFQPLTDFILWLTNNISTMQIDLEYTYNNQMLQICNISFISLNSWEINYTINNDKSTIYNIINSDNIITSYKYVSLSLNYNKLFLSIKSIDNHNIFTTNNLNYLIPIIPAKQCSNFMYFNINNKPIIFKNNNLGELNKINFSILNSDGNPLYNNKALFDYNINSNFNNVYSNQNYYLRHPLNKTFQTTISLGIGIVEPSLFKSINHL